MIDEMITEKKFAEILGIKMAGLRARRSKGEDIVHYKIGRKILYKVSDINAFLETKKVEPKK